MFKHVAALGLGSLLLITPLIASATTPPLSDDYGDGTTAGAYCPHLTSTFQRGARDATTGGQVSELQSFLSDYYDLDDGVLVGGFFGRLTQKYVVQFQTEQGLPAYGIVGMLTRAKIKEVCGGATPEPMFIKVKAPNGGEQWEIGQLNSILWEPYGYNPDTNPSKDVDVYLTDERGNLVGKIMDTGKASLHTYFNIDSYQKWAKPGSYLVEVINRVTGARDRSDAAFTLLPRAVDLKINGSDGPVTVTDNEAITVSWEIGQPWVSMEGGCTLTGVRATPGSGTHSLQVSGSNASATYYAYAPYPGGYSSVQLSCVDGAKGLTHTDYASVISKGGTEVIASVKVLEPNGGEQIPTGTGYPSGITWSQTGLKSVSIALYRNDQFWSWLHKDVVFAGNADGKQSVPWVPGDGTYPFETDSKVYKIYITGQKADGTGYVDDKSDSPFSFGGNGTGAVPSVTINTGGPGALPISYKNLRPNTDARIIGVNLPYVNLPITFTNVYPMSGSVYTNNGIANATLSGSGQYNIPLPSTFTAGNYVLELADPSIGSVIYLRSSPFNIAPGTPPTLGGLFASPTTLPSGGGTVVFTWNCSALGGTEAHLYVAKGSVPDASIGGSSWNDGLTNTAAGYPEGAKNSFTETYTTTMRCHTPSGIITKSVTVPAKAATACPLNSSFTLPPSPAIGASNTSVPTGCPVDIAWNGGSSAYQCYVHRTDATGTDLLWTGVSTQGHIDSLTSDTTFKMTCLDTSGGYISGTPISVQVRTTNTTASASQQTNVANALSALESALKALLGKLGR